MMTWRKKEPAIPVEGKPNKIPTEQEEFIEQERFEFWHRFCENKTALLGLVILLLIIAAAVFAPLIADYDSVISQNTSARTLKPGIQHWFGTDGYGRDVFARVIWGARTSLFIAFATILVSCVAGMFLGVLCGFYGGVLDTIVMRIVDVFMCLPPLLFSLSIVSALGNGMWKLIMAVGITMMPYFTRVVRATVMSVVTMDYIEAARSNGASSRHIIFRHIIPNCMGPIIVEATISLSSVIMIAAGLSFIGLGVQPPTPEWGSMLSDAREYMRKAPWMVMAPGLAIMLTSLSFNLVGDGVRDAMDPRQKK